MTDYAEDKRDYDVNGWFEVKDNPISRVGVFPYSGAQLGLKGDDAGRIFRVLRPPEELSDPACLESFKLLPWVDEHKMIGPTAQQDIAGAVPAEQKGVHGVIGENVYFKDGVIFANIKAFSSTLASLIEAGKRELSAGYRCVYDMTAGIWDGQEYDAVQRQIRGNHLALVSQGRMGPDVAVLDHLTFTFDAAEIKPMADETNTEETTGGGSGAGSMTLEQVAATLAELVPQIAKITELMGPLLGAAEKTEHQASGEPEAMEDKDTCAPPPAMDAAEITRKVIESVNQRDRLAAQLSKAVGVFDHASLDLAGVVAYGCDKLGIKAEPGQEAATLAGYLQALPAIPAATVTAGQDSKAPTGNFIDKHLNGG